MFYGGCASKTGLRRLSLLKLSCSSPGFLHLAALVLEGRLIHLHLRLHLTKYWRSRAESITSRHGVQSSLMLADPMDHLGRDAFQHTMEQAEEGTAEWEAGWRSKVEGVEEEARGDRVLGAVMGEEGVRYQPRAHPGAGEKEVRWWVRRGLTLPPRTPRPASSTCGRGRWCGPSRCAAATRAR